MPYSIEMKFDIRTICINLTNHFIISLNNRIGDIAFIDDLLLFIITLALLHGILDSLPDIT